MISNKKQMFLVIGVFAILLMLTTITYAFFNYTRTGLLNNIGTGRIYFYSNQGNTLNLTNMFPVASNEVDSANLDSISINIVGDTTYADGEEFLVSIVDVNNTITSGSTEKVIPVNYVASYIATPVATGEDPNTIGTSSDDYWNARDSKNSNIYRLYESGEVEENKQVLVGFIKNDNTGINGTLAIKAYIDSSKIAISDTYPESEPGEYQINPNMTQEELTACVNYLIDTGWELFDDESFENFCMGTGTIDNDSFQDGIDDDWWDPEDYAFFESHNILIRDPNYSNGTTDEWVSGRTVLTTSEWNTLQNTPLSFKIRVESNEGIWVEVPGGIKTCPECKYIYSERDMFTTWNTGNNNPSILTEGLYDNYLDLVNESGKNYFLGVKLNDQNEVTNAYACGIYHNVTPFCIEGYYDDSKYESNYETLQTLWGNTCTIIYPGTDDIISCNDYTIGNVVPYARINGEIGVNKDDGSYYCEVSFSGFFRCLENMNYQ